MSSFQNWLKIEIEKLNNPSQPLRTNQNLPKTSLKDPRDPKTIGKRITQLIVGKGVKMI